MALACGPAPGGFANISDAHFPNAAKIVLVQDNLSTHTPAPLHAAFSTSQARRLD